MGPGIWGSASPTRTENMSAECLHVLCFTRVNIEQRYRDITHKPHGTHTIQWFFVHSLRGATIPPNQFWRICITPSDLHHHSSLSLQPPSSKPPATTNPLPVWMDLSILDISYKWDIQNVVLCAWLLSLSLGFLRCIHDGA